MNALVIYDSVFGNTEKIAQAMAKALDCPAIKADAFDASQLDGVGLLLVGSPTRAFQATSAVKQFLKAIPTDALSGVSVAGFDTRMDIVKVDNKFLTFMAGIFGYAAEPISKRLAKKGCTVAAEPAGFVVVESEGPLADGELERAVQWALGAAGQSATT